ncbi:hypothetical protein PV379_00520 [Streptomyces caniscabiei]|uniref:hypothetical protein n=1 Tax=Streptomyces caniscabiei TaxID=2746961 RepID=UPI0029BC31D7|nr:hypothetical protein [Streptomyces caniscabiei]MDX2775840.1 hypothetical protein [Streptomyces caniscabiei]
MEKAPSRYDVDQEPRDRVSAETVAELEFAFLVSPDTVPAMGSAALRDLNVEVAPAAYENALQQMELESGNAAEAAKGDVTRCAIGAMATYNGSRDGNPTDVMTSYGNDDTEQ